MPGTMPIRAVELYKDPEDGEIVWYEIHNPDAQIRCTCSHPATEWCVHKIIAIKTGADGPYIRKTLDPNNGVAYVKIPMSVKHKIEIDVKLDLDLKTNEIHVIVNSALLFHVIPSNRTDLGILGENEGRWVIRYMLVDMLDSLFVLRKIYPEMDPSTICKSPRHSMFEHAAWEAAKDNPEDLWAYKFGLLLNNGVCNPCQVRMNAKMADVGTGVDP